jgi:hypothetical protein
VQRILKAEGARAVQAVGRGERSAFAGAEDASEPVHDVREAVDPGSVEDDPVSSTAGPALASHDLQRLRAALAELRECDRVLTALKAPADQ